MTTTQEHCELHFGTPMNIYHLLLTITPLPVSAMMKKDCCLPARPRDTPNAKGLPELTEFTFKT